MVSILAKEIMSQFSEIIEKMARECGIRWNECDYRFTSRKMVDQLVIQVYHRRTDPYLMDPSPLPLVTVNFTDQSIDSIKSEKWIRYLKRKSNQLLKEVQKIQGSPFYRNCHNCCHDAPPINTCDCVYREDLVVCEKKPCGPSVTQAWTRGSSEQPWIPQVSEVVPPSPFPGSSTSTTHTINHRTPYGFSHSSSHQSSFSSSSISSVPFVPSKPFVCPIHPHCHDHARHHKICHKINAPR